MEVKVRVHAGARREKFAVRSEREFEISVREKALDNAANRRILELLALHFNVTKSRVRMIRGHRASSKVIEIS